MVLASRIFLCDIRYIQDIFGKNAPYLPSMSANKIFVSPDPTSYEYRSVQLLRQHAINEVLRPHLFAAIIAVRSSLLHSSDCCFVCTPDHHESPTDPTLSLTYSSIQIRSTTLRYSELRLTRDECSQWLQVQPPFAVADEDPPLPSRKYLLRITKTSAFVSTSLGGLRLRPSAFPFFVPVR